MRRAAISGVEALHLDADQRRVLASPERVLVVHGAAGTGKSSLAVEIVADAVAGGLRADECLVLTASRLSAARLREAVTTRLDTTSTGPSARSHQAYAFGLLRRAAALAGGPTPRLLNGPEQDVVLRELLAGYAAGDVPGPQWPQDLREALPTRGFRGELRDLLMRAVEWGCTAQDLRDLAARQSRPEWSAAADVLDDYDAVTALSRPGAFDPAWILGSAADLLIEDAQARDTARAEARLLVVDDAQELSHAVAGLLRALVGPDTRVRLLADPDSTVQGFRGADPGLVDSLAREWSAPDPILLGTSHRQPELLRAAAARVETHIGAVAGAGHREVLARPGGRVQVELMRSVAQEAQFVAGVLRRAHLIEGVPWSELAVVVRGQGRSGNLRRTLSAAGVPVSVPPTTVPLRDEPAVRPFLTLLDLASGGSGTEGVHELLPAVVVDLLCSPIGGADAVTLRRLRRLLRRDEIDSGGTRSGDELLTGLITSGPGGALLSGPDGAAARRIVAVLDAARAGLASPEATAEDVLWSMWAAAGVASVWEQRALEGGAAGRRADRDLDAVLALFAAAEVFTDRLPGAGAAAFGEHVRGQDLPGDRLVTGAPDEDAVELLTPAAAAGRQWHTVVVAGVQEGVWPDLRLRGSLLGSEHLVDVLAGRGTSWRAAAEAVRHDETRQFHLAVTRARERLVVTAVRSEDEQPSVFLDLIDPRGEVGQDHHELLRPFSPVLGPLSLPALVAQQRRILAMADSTVHERESAARSLARLAQAGVAGADPDTWWALTELSDDRPLREADEPVRVSPSKVEQFTACGLNWLLTTRGGGGPDIGAASVGVLVHEIAAELADTQPQRMHTALDERWSRLGLGESWMAKRQQQEAHRMIDNLLGYLRSSADAGWAVVAVEESFSALVGRALLTGQVDRLERHADRGLRVIDYKTGSTLVTKNDLTQNAQLGSYQVAVAEGAFGAGEQPAGAALVQLGKAARANAANVQEQEAITEPDSWAHHVVAQAADGMADRVVTARENSRCRICPVKRCCPLQPEGGSL
ncbi:ATP-dependent helicase [Dermacoccaceae bacterium W4C1]